MKAICVVAHPDDCIIFAYAFIDKHPEYKWTVAYLTHKEESPRGQEIKQFWNNRGIETTFLGFTDNPEDNWVTSSISFDIKDAECKIQSLVQDYELILTHNKDGEYGHIHHKFVANCLDKFNNVVTFFHKRKIHHLKFLSYKRPLVNLIEVPLHANVIKDFYKQPVCSYAPRSLRLLIQILFKF